LIDAENKALKNMTIFDIEARYRTLKGDLRWAHLRSTPRQLPNGATLWDGLEIDITERKQAEETLRDTETRYRLLFEHSPDGILIIDPVTARPLEFNETAHRQLGYTREGFSNLRIFDLEAAETPEETKSHIAHVMRKGRADFETLQRNRQGEIRNVQVTAQIIEVLGKPVYHCIWRDITNRKRAEEALHKAEWEKAAILDAMSEIVIYLDVDMRIIWSNSGVNRQFNLTPEQVNGNYCYEILHKLNKPCKVCPAFKAIETGEPHVIDDFSSYGKRWTLRAYPVRNEREEIVGIVEIVTDITERKRAEEELKESERRCSDIIEFLPDATLVIDKDEKVIAWNRAIEAMTGIKKENMIGKGNHEYSLPFYGDRRPILIDIALHPDKETEKRYTAIQRVGDILFGESFTPNLPPGDIHLSATASVLRDYKGEVTAAIECIRDNTERKRLEERLNRAEKMEGLGRLAGGVAHDLNNILGVLVGYAELLRDKMPADSPLRRYADNIFQSGMRGAAIIQDLLTLARRGVNVSEVVDLNRIVYDYLRTPEFESLKSHQPGVKIWTELEGELLNVKGSPVHLNKTLMNLVSNAVEAISGQGEVMIRTENRYLDHSIRGYDEMQEGDYVILTVSDTGSGISASDLRKIFEPFYTKKVMGRSGTGLGLAVVWGTVKDHNGYIDVQSEEGQGSTFTIYFPVTREEPVKVEKAVSPASYMGKGESILIVDDVKEQRELAMSMLGSLGYQSEAVASGEEAVAYLKKKKADLIVLDMIMEPGMDGMETYRRIIEINHEQKAIIVSGFSETDRVKKAQEIGAGAFVRKPYILEKIGLAVRRELDRK
jgi:PAS domain S-box-containing protein